MTEMLPILARGEAYAMPVFKKGSGAPKPRPHEYEEARERLLSNMDIVLERIDTNPGLYLDEKVICVRMEPKFEAKSYVPSPILSVSDDMKFIGGRKYKIEKDKEADDQNSGIDLAYSEYAKLYFLRTTTSGLVGFKNVLRDGTITTDAWRNTIMSLRSLDLLSPKEKILGFDSGWQEGLVEVVLHPFRQEEEKRAVDLFCREAGLDRGEIEVRTYKDGVTFIAAKLSMEAATNAAHINPLRTVHPMGRICFEPVRNYLSSPAPQVHSAHGKALLNVGVFDGGCADVPLLSGQVTSHDCVSSVPEQDGIDHGSGVCGTVLYGELSGKGPQDILPAPAIHVESFRVLPPNSPTDINLYESIDAIEHVVKSRPDIPLYNLSFGPRGAILEDDISRFTYALDLMSFDRNNEPPLFCVAVGNDGDLSHPFNRIQSPSDLINGVGVGAYCYSADGKICRAPYSCIGPGREGAKIKPDILEYGGSLERPFIVVGSSGNTLGASAGTSFASPLIVHKLGTMMAYSEDISQHLARAILLHGAEHDDSLVQEEYGFGISPVDPLSCLSCIDSRVTTFYQGVLKPRQVISLPIFAPGIHGIKGNVVIRWTIIAVCDINPNDSDAYTSSCIVDAFIPHSQKYKYYNKKTRKTATVDLSTEEGQRKAVQLEAQGYVQPSVPNTNSAKKYWNETELRANDLKWDTVISRTQRVRGSSLFEPALTLQSIFRDTEDSNALTRYYAVVTVDAPNYPGSLYDATLQQYQNLQPIRLRIEPRLEARN